LLFCFIFLYFCSQIIKILQPKKDSHEEDATFVVFVDRNALDVFGTKWATSEGSEAAEPTRFRSCI
jgi:hypothetical protein